MKERLQKIISRAGIASRRKAERMILEGRVRVDGKVVNRLGEKADPYVQRIEIDGKPLSIPPPIYIMLYKPRNYLTTLYDPKGRPKVSDLLKDIPTRVFPVGRLDFDAEGLLILTNDGDLANALMHPRYKVPKTYLVKIKGIPSKEEFYRLSSGIRLEDGVIAKAEVEIIKILKRNTWLKMIIKQGIYHQIKRMCLAIGHPVIRIKRIAIGNLQLGDLRPGEYRYLRKEEIKKIRNIF